MSLLTTAYAVFQARIDDDEALAAAADIAQKVATANALVLRYLKLEDESGIAARDLPIVIDAAATMFAYLWRLRDEDEKGEFEPGFLPRPVTALLYPLRDPTLA